MSDEQKDETTQGGGWPPASGTAEQGAPRVGFCQDCGRPLTAETVRTVGTGVFCEPCLAVRVGGPNPAAGYGAVPPFGTPVGTPFQPLAGDANPTTAGWLGLIPGVGAMYNGQYAKAVAHLFIFVVLVSLKDNVSHVFDVFVAAWVFYQVFDAYHTAKARRDGLPLPNPFGLNDIGEWMGYGRNWTVGVHVGQRNTSPTEQTTPTGKTTPQPPPPYGSAGGPVSPVSGSGDWIGYVPPTHFAANVPPAYAAYPTPGQTAPYAAGPPTAAGWAAVPPVPPVPPMATPVMTPAAPPVSNTGRLPAGALWLIALGVLILAANLVPHWSISERWWPPVLLAGLSIWIFLRRLRRGTRWVCDLRAPVVLMALAIYSGCHAAYYMVSFGMFCAVLLILLGVLLLLERTVGAGPQYGGPQYVAGYPPIPAAPESTGRASFVPAAEESAPLGGEPTPAEPSNHEGAGQ
jgi:hypothetical protein